MGESLASRQPSTNESDKLKIAFSSQIESDGVDERHEVAVGGEFGDSAAGLATAVSGVETAIEHDGRNFGGYSALDHGKNVEALLSSVDFLDHEVVAR